MNFFLKRFLLASRNFISRLKKKKKKKERMANPFHPYSPVPQFSFEKGNFSALEIEELISQHC